MKDDKICKLAKILKLVGIILTGLFGIIILGGDKVTSGILLIATMIFMLLPIKQSKILRLIRIGAVCVVFSLVLWNISATELPSDNPIMGQPVDIPKPIITYSTGVKFFDQLIHIFNGFLEGRVFQGR